MRECLLVKNLVDESEVLVDEDGVAIADRDARALLPTVLKRLQAEARQASDVLARRVHAENRAGFLEPVRSSSRWVARMIRGVHVMTHQRAQRLVVQGVVEQLQRPLDGRR